MLHKKKVGRGKVAHNTKKCVHQNTLAMYLLFGRYFSNRIT